MFDTMIQETTLRRLTDVNISQLSFTQIGVEYVKLTNPNVIKNFKLFFNDMILHSPKNVKGAK